MPRLHSGAAIDRPKVTHLTLPPIPEVVWQQPQETHSTNIHNVLTNETQKDTHIPEFKQRNNVEAKHKRRQQGNLISSIRIQYGITPRKPN